MPTSADADLHRIPLVGIDDAALNDLGASALPAPSRLEPRPRRPGVNMDAASLAIVVPAVASVVVAAISAVASIWVAKLNSRGKADAARAPAAKPPAIEIETFATTVRIPVDAQFEATLAARLPAPRSITVVRFVPGG
jgi:hypothetical protein